MLHVASTARMAPNRTTSLQMIKRASPARCHVTESKRFKQTHHPTSLCSRTAFRGALRVLYVGAALPIIIFIQVLAHFHRAQVLT